MTPKPTPDMVLAAMRTLGKPASADRILESLLTDHAKLAGSDQWTGAHVTHALLQLMHRGTVDRVGYSRTEFAARRAGRPVPLYAVAPERKWAESVLCIAASRLGGALGDDLLKLRDELRAKETDECQRSA